MLMSLWIKQYWIIDSTAYLVASIMHQSHIYISMLQARVIFLIQIWLRRKVCWYVLHSSIACIGTVAISNLQSFIYFSLVSCNKLGCVPFYYRGRNIQFHYIKKHVLLRPLPRAILHSPSETSEQQLLARVALLVAESVRLHSSPAQCWQLTRWFIPLNKFQVPLSCEARVIVPHWSRMYCGVVGWVSM